MIITQEYINKLLNLPKDFIITRLLLEIGEQGEVQYDIHGIEGKYIQDDKTPRTKIIKDESDLN